MTQSARVMSIVIALAFAAVGQVANATPQTQATKPYVSDEAFNDVLPLSGKVVETMDAGGYSYVLLEKKGARTWVAVPKMKVTVGEEMNFQPGQEMVDFPSKSLKRTFEKIYFSGGPIGPKEAARKEAAKDKKDVEDEAMKTAHGGKSMDDLKGKAAPSLPAADNNKVEKATGPNAATVAELYEKKGKLDKQKVVVRGKVVKVSQGIMGKNWVHLRDGSGDEAQQTNNLVVTTQDTPAVGDVVTASGTLYNEKDFGAGYKYDVIIEEATLKQ